MGLILENAVDIAMIQIRNVDIAGADESVNYCIEDIKYLRKTLKMSLIKFSIKPEEWR